jgi:endonuclease/exonuclease/phosphatase family metal-dependent hydrolase
MWAALANLRASSTLPWALIGDFNEAVWPYEHFSACPRAEAQMATFRDCVQLCGLTDLGFSGWPYTYDNQRAGVRNVQVRLDRALADDAWRDIYSDSSVIHLVTPCSDHCPLLWSLVDMLLYRKSSWQRKKRSLESL